MFLRLITACIITFSFLLTTPAFSKTAPVADYGKMPNFYDADLSPDGKFLAAIVDTNSGYSLRVFNLADPMDKTSRATKYPKSQHVNWVKWANNDTLLVSIRQTQKVGSVELATGYLYVIDKGFKSAEVLLKPKSRGGTGSNFKRKTGFRQFNNVVVDFLPDDPDHILMSYGIEDQFKPGIYKMNINSRSARRLKNGRLNVQHWMTDLNNEPRIGQGTLDSDGSSYMTIRETNSDNWTNVSDYPGLQADTDIISFTSNPNEVIIADYNGKNTLGFYVYDLAQKRQTRKLYHHENYDVDRIIKSPDGKKIVGISYTADEDVRVYFDAAFKAKLSPIENQFKDFAIDYIDMTPNADKILFKVSAPSLPASLYLYTASTGEFSLLGEDFPEIGKRTQGDVTSISYKARDGYKIKGYLTTPPKIADGAVALKDLPFVILPHGGPYSRDAKSFDVLAQFIASRGYSVLQMNFRGSEGLGRNHELAGRKNWEVMQEDVEDATRWLIRKGYADPNRICIMGWSYGGYAALMGAIKDPELYQCAISIAGVTDLFDMVRDIKRFRFGRFTAENFILKGFEDRDNIKENSPVKRADELTAPLLLVHGTKDIQVQYDQFKRMKASLKRSPAKTTFLSLDKGDHSLATTEHRLALFKAIDSHLAQYLGKSEAAP